MTKIRMVGACREGDGFSGVALDIHFINGQAVILPVEAKARDLGFVALLKDRRLLSPKTDGEQVYWWDGLSLSCSEILQIVRGDAG